MYSPAHSAGTSGRADSGQPALARLEVQRGYESQRPSRDVVAELLPAGHAVELAVAREAIDGHAAHTETGSSELVTAVQRASTRFAPGATDRGVRKVDLGDVAAVEVDHELGVGEGLRALGPVEGREA